MNFRNIPPVVKNLLIINGLFYLATILLKSQGIDLGNLLGIHYFESDGFNPYQFVTYMFMHSSRDFTHVLFNMFAVWMFGRVLESTWGSKRFLIYYMVTGVGAAILQQIVHFVEVRMIIDQLTSNGVGMDAINQMISTGSFDKGWLSFISESKLSALFGAYNYPTVGASGAVFGILLAFGMLFPNTELMLLFPPIPIKAKWFVIGYGAIELYSGFANNPNDNVAHFAHLGGMLFGFILIKMWQKDRNHFY